MDSCHRPKLYLKTELILPSPVVFLCGVASLVGLNQNKRIKFKSNIAIWKLAHME